MLCLNLKLLLKAMLFSSTFSVGLELSFFNCYLSPIDSLFPLEDVSDRESTLNEESLSKVYARLSYLSFITKVFLCSSGNLVFDDFYNLHSLNSSADAFKENSPF